VPEQEYAQLATVVEGVDVVVSCWTEVPAAPEAEPQQAEQPVEAPAETPAAPETATVAGETETGVAQ
jgi:hypothetical protein